MGVVAEESSDPGWSSPAAETPMMCVLGWSGWRWGLRAWRLLGTGGDAGEDFVGVVDEGGEMSSVFVDAETGVG